MDVKRETRDKIYGKNYLLYIVSFNVTATNDDQVTVSASLLSTNGDASLPLQIEIWPIDDSYGYISNITTTLSMKEQILLEYSGKPVQQYYVRVRSFYTHAAAYGEFSVTFKMEKKLDYGLIFGLAIGIPCGVLLIIIVFGALAHVKVQKIRLDNYDNERQAPKHSTDQELRPNVTESKFEPEYEVEPLPILSDMNPETKEEPPKYQEISSEDLIKFEGQSMSAVEDGDAEVSVVFEEDLRVSMPRVPLPRYASSQDVHTNSPITQPIPSSNPPYVETPIDSVVQPETSPEEVNFDISVPIPDKI